MVFSSITFLYYFLPLTVLLYFLSPACIKNTVLFVCSLVFYAWGEPKYVFLMGISIWNGYVCGLFVEKYRERTSGRIFCAISVLLSLSVLIYFKYMDFFLENISALTGVKFSLLHAALPVGISFYTFQIISYTVDVYRGEAAQKNLLSLAVYISMFPQLVAGPIVRYADLAKQLASRKHSYEKAAYGIRRFVCGLAKKVLLANQMWELCGVFRASQEKSVLFYWLYAAASAFYVYFDFSGYSDMAIGLCRIFGFQIAENFNYPFISASITEFWRRWHISLGRWFRDYVYIPLGGNRAGKGRQMFHIFVVWMLTGFWHGAAWNFLMWGFLFAVLLTAEKFWILKFLQKSRILSRVYVLFFILVSFLIFNAKGPGQAVSDIGGLFGAGGTAFVSAEALYCLKSYAVVLLICAAGSTPAASYVCKILSKKPSGSRLCSAAELAVLPVLLLLVTAYLADGSFQPFLYFRF